LRPKELLHNLAASMKKVARVRREMQTYTPEEIRGVLRAADKDRNGHLWYLALSGLRRGEIAGLFWDDIDFAAGTSLWHAAGFRWVRQWWSRTNQRPYRHAGHCL
jgi:integrase